MSKQFTQDTKFTAKIATTLGLILYLIIIKFTSYISSADQIYFESHKW